MTRCLARICFILTTLAILNTVYNTDKVQHNDLIIIVEKIIIM